MLIIQRREILTSYHKFWNAFDKIQKVYPNSNYFFNSESGELIG